MISTPSRTGFCVIILLFLSNIAFSQYFDSLNFVNAKWNIEKINKSTKLVTKKFENKTLFSSNQNISYVIIKNKSLAGKLAIAAEPQLLRVVSDFATENNAVAAINGNFFDIKNGGAVDFTKVNGQVVNKNKTPASSKLSFHQKASIVLNDGILGIIKWDGFVNWDESIKADNVMLSGPLLRLNRVDEKLDSSSFYITRHPRTCVGITKRGKVIMLVADGRNINAAGLTIAELAKIMRWLGCVSSINFDGGGSTTLWVKNRGVINYPSDNGKWDHEGERKVANVLFVKKKK